MGKRISTHSKRDVFGKWFWTLGVAAALTFCSGCGASFTLDDNSEPSASPGPGDTASVNIDTEPRPDSKEEPGELSSDDAWSLILVNPWNPIPEDYSVPLIQLRNGQAVHERCYPDLQDMMDACRADGLSPLICSSYRTREFQETLYNNNVEQLMARGCTRAEAEAETKRVIAIPGTSEHQLGLAVDIVDLDYQLLDRAQEETDVQKWLMEHCWEYGFILRYPEGKSEITGISYEPWHYRYVGKEAAKEIAEAGICLEEYIAAR